MSSASMPCPAQEAAFAPLPPPSSEADRGELLPLQPRLPAVAACLRDWQRLAAGGPPFLGPEFFLLSRPLFPHGEPLLAVARRGGRLVAVLPLLRQGRTLVSLRSDHSPRFDLCGDAGALPALWAALAREPGWDQLVLEHVPADSPLATALPARARAAGYLCATRPGARQPRFSLPGFEARMDPKFRANLRRCERKAGGVQFERLPAPSRAAFEEGLAIEAQAWKGACGTSISSDGRLRHLYRALGRLYGRRGQFAISFIVAEHRRIGFLYSLEDRDTFYAMKIGYDPGCAELSPGQLVILAAARDAERRGLRVFDLLGHDDPWKLRWTREVRAHEAQLIYRPSPRGLLAYTLRELVKPRLLAPLLALGGRAEAALRKRARGGDPAAPPAGK